MIVILTAIFFTGSNGATAGLSIGLGVAFALQIRRVRGPIHAIAAVALLALFVGLAGPHVDVASIQEKAGSSVQLLRDSVGRSDGSGSEREVLFSEGMRLFRTGDLIGVAPGRTKRTLADQGASYSRRRTATTSPRWWNGVCWGELGSSS